MANPTAEAFVTALRGRPVGLAAAKDALIAKGNDGGIDMIKYKVYAEEERAKGRTPLPPKSWAIANLNSSK